MTCEHKRHTLTRNISHTVPDSETRTARDILLCVASFWILAAEGRHEAHAVGAIARIAAHLVVQVFGELERGASEVPAARLDGLGSENPQ